MRTFKPKKNRKIRFTGKQLKMLRDKKATTRALKSEIGVRKEGAYCVAKLRSQGLWDSKQNKNTLTVRRISDLSPEERKEMGLDA